jgi:SAM-dependent methyltransferase
VDTHRYVHGYSEREHARLHDQATTLTDLLHGDTFYPAGSRVLEAGCGVGAQTVILAGMSPEAEFLSVDISGESLGKARALAKREGLKNVRFQRADIYNLPFQEESFDHVFICFVLEHLSRPSDALFDIRRVLKAGGSLTVIEGDHGSAYFHPESVEARKAVGCLIRMQEDLGGDSLIGRRLYPLLCAQGFSAVSVSPRMVYVDGSKPELVEGFTRHTFIAMVEGVRRQVLDRGIMDEPSWEKGIQDLKRAAEADGTFCYTFFKATAIKA